MEDGSNPSLTEIQVLSIVLRLSISKTYHLQPRHWFYESRNLHIKVHKTPCLERKCSGDLFLIRFCSFLFPLELFWCRSFLLFYPSSLTEMLKSPTFKIHYAVKNLSVLNLKCCIWRLKHAIFTQTALVLTYQRARSTFQVLKMDM